MTMMTMITVMMIIQNAATSTDLMKLSNTSWLVHQLISCIYSSTVLELVRWSKTSTLNYKIYVASKIYIIAKKTQKISIYM